MTSAHNDAPASSSRRAPGRRAALAIVTAAAIVAGAVSGVPTPASAALDSVSVGTQTVVAGQSAQYAIVIHNNNSGGNSTTRNKAVSLTGVEVRVGSGNWTALSAAGMGWSSNGADACQQIPGNGTRNFPLTITTSGTTTAQTYQVRVTATRWEAWWVDDCTDVDEEDATQGTGTLVVNSAIGPPAKLAFTTQPPASPAAGAAFSTSVTVQDANSNSVTSPNYAVSLAIDTNPAGGTLSGCTSAVTSSGGVATFSGCSLDKAGSGYKLKATATGLTTAVSNTFSIVAGAAAQLAFTTQPGTSTAGEAVTGPPAVTVTDAHGNLKSGASVSMTKTTGPGPFTGSTTTVTSDPAGIATFDELFLTAAGSYTITASAGSAEIDSDAFTVNPATANTLAFTPSTPGPATAGGAIPNVAVSVEDIYGNVKTTMDSGSVTIGVKAGSPQASFTSGTTSANVDNGVATFSNLVVETAGSYTLTAAPVAISGATEIDSNAFTVNPAAASALTFDQQPTDTVNGGEMSPVNVRAWDQYGNAVTDDGIAITLTAPSGIDIEADSEATVDGVATFDSVVINTTALNIVLTASGPTGSGIDGATSAPFTVYESVINGVEFNSTATDTHGLVAGSGVRSVTFEFCPVVDYSTGCTGNWTAIDPSPSAEPYTVAWTSQPANGSYLIRAVATDNLDHDSLPSTGLPVMVNNVPLSVTTSSLPDGEVDTPYSATLEATGGVAPYAWALTGGALPAGLTFNPFTGDISGTPTAAGTSSNLVFQATGADNATASSGSLSIAIAAVSVFFVPDSSDDVVYVYGPTGADMGSWPLSTSAGNGNASGAAVFGSKVYVLDSSDDRVYRYSSTGAYEATSRLLRDTGGGSLQTPTGLAIDGDDMWLVEDNDDSDSQLYRYSLAAAFTGSENLSADDVRNAGDNEVHTSNDDPTGMAIDATYLYVTDEDEHVYRYLRSGPGTEMSASLYDTSGTGGSDDIEAPTGAVIDGNFLWLVDNDTNRAYRYSISALLGGSSTVNADQDFGLHSNNGSPQGL